MVLPLLFPLLAGCSGSTPQPPRPEAFLQAETALKKSIRAEQKGDRPEAERLLTQSLNTSSSIENYPARSQALINLARLNRLSHNLSKAETYIDQVLETADMEAHLSAEAAYEKALIKLVMGNPAHALEWAQKAVTSEPGSALGRRLNLVGRIQLVRGAWSDADTYARKALSENRASGQVEEEANSLRILGVVARNEKNYDLGEIFLQEALEIDKRIGKSAKIAVDLGELSKTARDAGNLKVAANYLERAYQVNLAAGRLRQAMENQQVLAVLYATQAEEHKSARAREAVRKLELQIANQSQNDPSDTTNPSSRP